MARCSPKSAKTLFGTKKHENLAVDFLDAVLKFDGADCIRELYFVNTASGDELGTKHTDSDVVTNRNEDRIVLEFQHEGNDTFADRLVYYTSCNTIPLLHTGEKYYLNSLYTIGIQLFNLPLYLNDKVFYKKQLMKLGLCRKFLKSRRTWFFSFIKKHKSRPLEKGSVLCIIFVEESTVCCAMSHKI